VGLAILDFTSVISDIQTELITMDEIAVNHVQVVQAVCAGFPNKMMVSHEVDGLINSVSRRLGYRDIEKIHNCSGLVYDFMFKTMQPYSAPYAARYGCPGFYHNQAYIMFAPANDPNFIQDMMRMRHSMTNAMVDMPRLNQLMTQAAALDEQLRNLFIIQEAQGDSEELQQQVYTYQSALNQVSQEIERLKAAL
jgi:hypothetical protein